MSVTYLLSYPGPRWHIRGAANFRSTGRAGTSPRAAFVEWLSLADAITRAGGRILVMPPEDVDPPLTGMVYTANAGQLFHVPAPAGDEWVFVVSSMAVAHRQAERDPVARFVAEAGVKTRLAANVWEGQADLQVLPGNRFLSTYGVRSVKASVGDVKALLPSSAHVLSLELREPFFHGDTCLNPMVNRAGDTTLLVHTGAILGEGAEQLRAFVSGRADLLPVDEDDALAYACNALCVNGTVLMPRGVSTALRGQLVRRGFTIQEMDFGELFGKGGGGPRCLVNELRGLVLGDGAPSYALLRDELQALVATYPESYSPPTSGAPNGGAAATSPEPRTES